MTSAQMARPIQTQQLSSTEGSDFSLNKTNEDQNSQYNDKTLYPHNTVRLDFYFGGNDKAKRTASNTNDLLIKKNQ